MLESVDDVAVAKRVERAVIDPASIGSGDVLVLRALGVGDALTGIPALRALRRRFEDRRVVLAVNEPLGRWLAGLAVVEAICPTHELDPLPGMRGGHLAVDLHGNGPASRDVLQATGADLVTGFCLDGDSNSGPLWRQDEHEVLRWCRLVAWLGARPDLEDLRLLPRGRVDPARRAVSHRGPSEHPVPDPEVSSHPHVVIHPGAASASRRWGARRWAAVGRLLQRRGARVWLTGTAAEADLCAAAADGMDGTVVDLSGRLDLPGLTATAAAADLILSADTGIAHLATALGTPSVTLFGPTPPSEWGPILDLDLHIVLWTGRDGNTRGDPHGDVIDPRLDAISVEAVFVAAQAHLHRAAEQRAG